MPHEPSPWPLMLTTRAGPSSTARSGGDYVACRKQLLVRYAARWLAALHDQDPELYAKSMFDCAMELARSEDTSELRDVQVPETKYVDGDAVRSALPS